jgi:hypothetical protein
VTPADQAKAKKKGILDIGFLVPPPDPSKLDLEEFKMDNTYQMPAWIEVARAPLGDKLPQMYAQAAMAFSHHSKTAAGEPNSWMQPLVGLEVNSSNSRWMVALYGYSYCGTKTTIGPQGETEHYICVARAKILSWPNDCVHFDIGKRRKILDRMLAFPAWYAMRYNELGRQKQQEAERSDRRAAVLLPPASPDVQALLRDAQGLAAPKGEEAAAAAAAAGRKVFKIFDWREQNPDSYSRAWWMQLALMPGCRVVVAAKSVVLLEYPHIEAVSNVTVGHFVAVLEHLQRLHSGEEREGLERAKAEAEKQGDRYVLQKLEGLLQAGGRITHNDVRLSNMVLTKNAAESCLIDFDMAGRSTYPAHYRHDIKDGARHDDAEANKPTAVEHDLYAMEKALKLYGCHEDATGWAEALSLLGGREVDLPADAAQPSGLGKRKGEQHTSAAKVCKKGSLDATAPGVASEAEEGMGEAVARVVPKSRLDAGSEKGGAEEKRDRLQEAIAALKKLAAHKLLLKDNTPDYLRTPGSRAAQSAENE